MSAPNFCRLPLWAIFFVVGFNGSVVEARCALQDGEDLPHKLSAQKLLRVFGGQYLRHSSTYYRWVVQDRVKQLTTESDALTRSMLIDELALAHVHLKEYDKASTALNAKGKLRYRDNIGMANIFMAASEFAKSHKHFGAAFEMNPNGLFLDEGYGKHVLDHVAKQRGRGRAKVPVMILEERGEDLGGFATYSETISRQAGMGWNQRNWEAAVSGLLELILCGHRGSSIVWEALGDLLREAPDSFKGDGIRLAVRAYLLASYMTESLWGRMEYRGLAKALLTPPNKKSLRKFEKRYGKELAKGRKLFKRIKGDEKRWARGKGNVDRKFEQRYLPGTVRP